MPEDIGIDFLATGAVDAADKLIDTVPEVITTAKDLVKTATGVVKAIWNAPKAVGLKPIPTLAAGGVGVAAANAAGGTTLGGAVGAAGAVATGALKVGAVGAAVVGGVFVARKTWSKVEPVITEYKDIGRDTDASALREATRGERHASRAARTHRRRLRRARNRQRRAENHAMKTALWATDRRTERAFRRHAKAAEAVRTHDGRLTKTKKELSGHRSTAANLRQTVPVPRRWLARRALGFGREKSQSL